MPGIVGLRDAISDDVVAALAEASYPPLTDGEILLGRQHAFEQSAPPRIVFIPTKSEFSAKDVYSASNPTPPNPYTPEQLAQFRNPSILTDTITFEVQCWGSSPTQDPDEDFDYTQALYQQVLRSCDKLARGNYWVSGGTWLDQAPGSSQMIRLGRLFSFSLTFGTPVLSRIIALTGAPSDVRPNPTTTMELPTGDTSVGCSG